jgi:DNA polymerase-3 subunit gamma/tau
LLNPPDDSFAEDVITMEYQTLYRRWRPRKFSDFVGQQHVVTTLVHALASDRVAHAYLFTGPRGTGKTSIAKIFAKALNCLRPNGAEPCGECINCERIHDGIFLDVIEIDAASNRGIDEIRDLREKVRFAPAEGKYKIYIIDEVHMLTTEAFNALLKTLEEPPKYVVFILATTEVHKIPATILSRCQRFDFKRFTLVEIKGRLEEILAAEGCGTYSGEALDLIAEHAEGGMRDALGLLEQVLAHSQGTLEAEDARAVLGLTGQAAVEAMAAALLEGDLRRSIQTLAEVNQAGKDLFQFGRGLVAFFRDRLLAEVESGSGAAPEYARLARTIEALADAVNEVKRSQQSSLPLELAVIKITSPDFGRDDLEERVARLEQALQQAQTGGTALPKPALSPIPAPAARREPAATAAEPSATPAPARSAAGIFEEWTAFMEAVKRRKRTLAALIQEGKPVKCEGGQLTVELPSNLKFHLENLALPPNRELLEEVLAEVTGAKLSICCIPASGHPAEAKPEPPPPAPDPLAKAMALFGGEVRPVTKEEESK